MSIGTRFAFSNSSDLLPVSMRPSYLLARWTTKVNSDLPDRVTAMAKDSSATDRAMEHDLVTERLNPNGQFPAFMVN